MISRSAYREKAVSERRQREEPGERSKKECFVRKVLRLPDSKALEERKDR